MPPIQYVMACICGVETNCREKDQRYGAVWQCPACKVVTACVYPQGGGKVWIQVDPGEVEFYHLLGQPMNLFLDDERLPPDDTKEWVVVRSFDEAVTWVENNGFPSFVSFDNDLGLDSKEGWEFAEWLINHDLDTNSMPDDFQFTVHSQNPVRRADITLRLQRYIAYKRAQEPA